MDLPQPEPEPPKDTVRKEEEQQPQPHLPQQQEVMPHPVEPTQPAASVTAQPDSTMLANNEEAVVSSPQTQTYNSNYETDPQGHHHHPSHSVDSAQSLPAFSPQDANPSPRHDSPTMSYQQRRPSSQPISRPSSGLSSGADRQVQSQPSYPEQQRQNASSANSPNKNS